MISTPTGIEFTGEFFVPGQSGARIEADHYERYNFATELSRGKSVLDIACGVGYAGPMFIQAGATRYDGVDLNPELQAYAERTYGGTNIAYHTGDIRTVTLGRQFDLIVCFETIEHLPGYREALANLYRMLKDDGTLLISSPNRPITSPAAKKISDKPANEFHTQEFTPSELQNELVLAGFRSQDIYGQRQRYVFSSQFLNRITKKLFGDQDSRASAKLSRLGYREPRYFVIRAVKASHFT
jgi:SAM-dependent methyltransferase